jgi:hypothetical protein
MEARFRIALKKWSGCSSRRSEKASEVSPPDKQNQNETEAAMGSYVPNSKTFVNFWGRPSIWKMRPDLE